MFTYIGAGLFFACLSNRLLLLAIAAFAILLIWKITETKSVTIRFIILLFLIGTVILIYMRKLETIGLVIISAALVFILLSIALRLRNRGKNLQKFNDDGIEFQYYMQSICGSQDSVDTNQWLEQEIEDYMNGNNVRTKEK